MDAKDKKLIYLLDLNSRMKDSELAKQIITSKQVVDYRIKRLEKDGIIKRFQTVPNLESLGIQIYANVYFKLLKTNKTKEDKIINFLIKNNNVGYVALLGGRFDLSIVLVAKSLTEFEEKLNEIVCKFPRELRDYIVSLRIIGLKFNKKYLFQGEYKETKKVLSNEKLKPKFDELDKKILNLLAQNSRDSLISISEKLKEPFSTIRTRVRLLEEKKIIAGYTTLIDLNKIGINNYKLFIKVNDKSEDTYKKLLAFASSNPNIIWFFKTLGDHDYELRIEAENQEEYQRIVKEIRSEFSSSMETLETIIVFKELKEDYSVVFK